MSIVTSSLPFPSNGSYLSMTMNGKMDGVRTLHKKLLNYTRNLHTCTTQNINHYHNMRSGCTLQRVSRYEMGFTYDSQFPSSTCRYTCRYAESSHRSKDPLSTCGASANPLSPGGRMRHRSTYILGSLKSTWPSLLCHSALTAAAAATVRGCCRASTCGLDQ